MREEEARRAGEGGGGDVKVRLRGGVSQTDTVLNCILINSPFVKFYQGFSLRVLALCLGDQGLLVLGEHELELRVGAGLEEHTGLGRHACVDPARRSEALLLEIV